MRLLWICAAILSLTVLQFGDSYGASDRIIVEARTAQGRGTGKTAAARGPEFLRASFKEGVSALNKGDAARAGQRLDGLEEAYPVLGDYILYYRIRAALKMEDPSEALTLAGQLLEKYPESVLVLRVRLEIVRALISMKQFPAARAVAESLLKQQTNSELRRRASLLLSESLEGEKDWKGAQEVYQRLAFEDPVTPEGREAGQRAERIVKTEGVAPLIPSDSLYLARVQALNRSLRYDRVIDVCGAFQDLYPESPLLGQALLLKARALIKTEQPEQGTDLYEKLIDSGSKGMVQAEASYQLGNYYWNQDQDFRAKRIFKSLIRAYPENEWGLKGRYALGRIYENDQDISDAKESFLMIGEVNPAHPLAAESAWRAGWVEYKAGKYEKARDIFISCMQRYPDSDVFASALYWQGKCEEKLKHVEEEQRIFRGLAEEYPWNFYGAMARKRLESSWEGVPDRSVPSNKEDGAWQPEPIHAAQGSPLAFHLDRAEELIRIGFANEANEEIEAIQKQAAPNPMDLCYIAVLYEKNRNFFQSLRWILKNRACMSGRETNTTCMKRFLYPLANWEAVQREAGKNGLDPFLALAVMRQESLFQPDIVSPADARGLMQIIPSTGRTIARRLGITDFNPDNLYDPGTNITLGIKYLTDLMDRSDGDLVRVLCSYNAGETRSDQWWEQYKDLDVDERIESISFRETRDYVKKVLNHLEIYRRLYVSPSTDAGQGLSSP